MLVETFEQVETTGIESEDLSSPEAMALIESLGLTGQQNMIASRTVDDGEVLTRSPYRVMTAEEQHVYGVLCPQRTPIEDYGSGPIPVRVLQVAAHAREFFDRLEVWAPRDAQTKNPVLVGIKVTPSRWGGTDRIPHILARWGAELGAFPDLVSEARARLTAHMRQQAARARAELAAFESSLDTSIDAYLTGTAVQTPTIFLTFETR